MRGVRKREGSEGLALDRMHPRLELVGYRGTMIGYQKVIPTRARRVKLVVLSLTDWISSAVPRTVHVIGVGGCTIPGPDVGQIVILGRVTAIVSGIILGEVGGDRWRRRCGSGNTPHATCGKAAGRSGA